MSGLRQLDARLEALEATLADRPEAAGEIRAIRGLLADDETLWIDATEAKRLLRVSWVRTIKAWARLGILRSRHDPDGRLKVHLLDVLYQRDVEKALSAMGSIDTPLTDEERAELRRPASPEVEAIVNSVLAQIEQRVGTRTPAGVG